MATNIGGAQYTIEVVDKFSGSTKAFREELEENKKAFGLFRGEVATFAQQQGEIRENFKAFQKATSNISKNLGIQAKAIKTISTSIGADTNTKLATKVRHINAEANAVGRLTAATRERVKHVRKLREVTKFDIDREAQRLSAAKKATDSFKEFIKANRVQITSIRIKNKQLEREISNLKTLRKLSPVFAAASGQTPAIGGRRSTASTAGRAAQTKKTITETNRALLALRTGLDATALRANRISFTFRRLISILAAFTVVRRLTQGFIGLVKEAVTFNANIEQSTLGIASLLTAVGDVRDAYGEAVTPAQALELATQASRKQIQLLRVEALQTSATFKDLVDTFQVALAPGFQAGLNIDEIRAFTVQISQAATAIGLAQNQLAEEIRSLLAGTIQLRTTRIAAALGITNEDIRNAKDLGNLYGFLQDRFKAFTLAGEKSVQNFNTILTNLKDAISLVVGSGLRPFFESIKESLQQINALILDSDVSGNLTPSPTTVALLRVVSRILVEMVDKAKEFASQFTSADIFEVLRAVETGLLSALSAAIVSINVLVRGFREAARWARVVASFGPEIRESFNKLFPDPAVAQRLLTLFTTLLGASVAFRLVLFIISALIKTLILPISIIVGLVQSIIKPLGLMSKIIPILISPIAVIATLVATIVFNILKIASELFGFKVEVGTIIRLIIAGIKLVSGLWTTAFEVAEKAVTNILGNILKLALAKTIEYFNQVTKLISAVAGAFGFDGIGSGLSEAAEGVQRIADAISTDAKSGFEELTAQAVSAQEEIKALFETLGDDVRDAFDKQAAGEGGFDGLLEQALETVDVFLEKFKVSLPDAIDDATVGVKSMVEELSNLDPIISSVTEDLRDGQSTIEDMARESRKLTTELRFSAISLGSSDSLKGLLDIVKDTTIKVQQETEKADRKRRTALDTRNNLINKQKRLLEDVEELNSSATEATLSAPADNLRDILRLTKVIAEREKERVSTIAELVKRERELKKAKQVGDPQAIKQAENFVARGKDVASTIQAELKGAQAEMESFIVALIKSGATSREQATALVRDLVTTEGTLKATNEGLNEIARQRRDISDSQVESRDLQLRQVLQNSKFELDAEKRVAEAAVEATRLRLQAENSTLKIQKELLSAKANILEIDVELAEIRVEEKKNQEIGNALLKKMGLELESLITSKIVSIKGSEEENRLTGEILKKTQLIKDIRDDIADNTDILNLREAELEAIRAQEEREKKLRERGETSPVSAGLLLGINELIGTITKISAFININIAEAIQGAVVKGFDGATDILGDAIVEALDPTEKGFSIRAAFATLFRQISKDIFQALTSSVSCCLVCLRLRRSWRWRR
jgi:hypothetical protein